MSQLHLVVLTDLDEYFALLEVVPVKRPQSRGRKVLTALMVLTVILLILFFPSQAREADHLYDVAGKIL